MPNLTGISNLIKKYQWVIIPITIVILLLGLITIKFTLQNRPSKGNIINSPAIENLKINTGKFNFDNYKPPTDYPKKLPAYHTSLENLLANSDSIASKLNFNKPPIEVRDVKLGKGRIYNGVNQSATVYQNEFSYTKYGPFKLTGSFLPPETLKNKAGVQIADIFGSASLSQNFETSYFYFEDEFIVSQNNPDKANMVILNFHLDLSGYEVLLPGGKISATFNKDNELVQLTYKMPHIEAEIANYPLISPQKAKDLLVNGQASIIALKTQDDFSPLPQNLEQVNVKSAHLAYYLSEDFKTVQPVWVFSGESIVNGQPAEVLYSVPAIVNAYLQPPSPKP